VTDGGQFATNDFTKVIAYVPPRIDRELWAKLLPTPPDWWRPRLAFHLGTLRR